MVIDPSGNVGIGTTTPQERLHVVGNVAVSANNQLIARYTNPSMNYAASLAWGSLQLGNNGANYIIAGRTTPGGSLLFITDNTNDFRYTDVPSGKEVMRLTETGNVGIGTTSPLDKLSLGYGDSLSLNADDSAQTTRLRWRYQGGEYAWIERAHSSGDMVFGVDATERMRIHDGNVGIGTTSPGAKLDVNGDLRCRTDFIMRADAAPANQKAWRQYVDSATYYMATLNDNNANENIFFRVSRSGQAVSTVTFMQGNLGIGTTSPSARLEVVGEAKATVFTPTSDRNAKENFSSIDNKSVLEKVAALPITRWNFKELPGAEHIGPMAQDFYAAFGVGPDDKHIATVDADGVAFAAIQGLHEIVKEKDAEIQELKTRLERLEQIIAKNGSKD